MEEARQEQIRNLKEAILALCMLYFYGLSLALQFGKPTFGMERPWIFLPMSTLFLVAIALEALLAWWNRRVFLLWVIAFVVAYGFVWLYMAPAVYGQGLVPYVMLLPLAAVFYGGAAYSLTRLMGDVLFPPRPLSRAAIERELADLPGWRTMQPVLEKTYRFTDFEEATNFMNQVARVTKRNLLCTRLSVSYNKVVVQLYDWKYKGITTRITQLARRLDLIAS